MADTLELTLVNKRQLGIRIRELRKASGLNQTELAEKMGMKQNSFSNWERGTTCPDFADVVRLADVLGVDMSVFAAKPWPEDPMAGLMGDAAE